VPAIATAEIGAGPGFLAIGLSQRRANGFDLVLEADQFRVPFDGVPSPSQLFVQQAFVVVLRKAEREGIGAFSFADIAEIDGRNLTVATAQVEPFHSKSTREHLVNETELPIELERSRLNGDRPRRFPWPRFRSIKRNRTPTLASRVPDKSVGPA
jgi:hypothetical protein